MPGSDFQVDGPSHYGRGGLRQEKRGRCNEFLRPFYEGVTKQIRLRSLVAPGQAAVFVHTCFVSGNYGTKLLQEPDSEDTHRPN